MLLAAAVTQFADEARVEARNARKYVDISTRAVSQVIGRFIEVLRSDQSELPSDSGKA